MATNAGYLGSIYARTDDAATGMTDEACTEVTGTRFQITNAAKRYIDDTQSVTVKVNTVVQTSGYHIEYAGGFVVFDSTETGNTVTVTASYWTMAEVAQMYNWKASFKMGKGETTPFGTTTGVHRVATIGETSGSADGYWLTEDYYRLAPGQGALNGTNPLTGVFVPIKLYTNADYHYEGYACVDLDIDCSPGEVVKSNLTFEGEVFYARSDD